jgi:hypothetical protein
MAYRQILSAALLAAATVHVSAQQAPTPRPIGLPTEVLALACAPTLVFEVPPQPLRITGGQDSRVRVGFRPGDLITINAGTDNGIEVGQEYYVRRLKPALRAAAVSRTNPATIRTAGWIRIYAVDAKLSLATITHACDAIEQGDYLAPFALPQLTVPQVTNASPQRSNYGRVLLGIDNRRAFGFGDFFIVDRGSDHGVSLGAQFVVYRDKRQADNFLFILGEAVAVDVKPESSTLQVTMSRDAFLDGDLVALRK